MEPSICIIDGESIRSDKHKMMPKDRGLENVILHSVETGAVSQARTSAAWVPFVRDMGAALTKLTCERTKRVSVVGNFLGDILDIRLYCNLHGH